jgi:hypothetical protein
MCKQYWADASTRNCVWLFQIKEKNYAEDEVGDRIFESWRTEAVFLTKDEAMNHGKSRPYAWGDYEVGWRIWGVPCHGLMAEILGKHVNEFEFAVDYVG